ncbi:MAG: right-handed parallel beta-helix repeat-containing protein [Pseudonocardiaceae bacterium]
MGSPEPAAFLSYVRVDDQHEGGLISQFRERLSAEVRMQIGQEFPIFQDRTDIAWGQNWQTRINETLDTVTLLIPVMTPGFFASPACRQEVIRFVERERQLGRSDLILPVYYVGTPQLDDPTLRDSDPVATTLFVRQYADWRELRFEPFTAPVVRKALAQLAVRIRETLRQPPPRAGQPEQDGAAKRTTGTAQTPRDATERSSTVKQEPPTHVVDPLHRGDFPTITAAIRAARPGDRILVRPGLYRESVVLDKPLEIIGQGPVGEIVVQAQNANVLLFRTNIGRVTNLTLLQLGGKKVWYGVDIGQGRLELEGCDIISRSGSCVAIHGGADPRLRNNRIHDGNETGVYVYDNGLGTLEDNDIAGNTLSGVDIETGGNPTLRRNRIHDGKTVGVVIRENGLGTLEDNDIIGNTYAGVEIRTGGNPTLRRNRIYDGKTAGVFVHNNGLGTLEDNDIIGNTLSGVDITTGGNLVLRRNRINRNGYQAVWIHEYGSGVIEDNDLSDNTLGAWNITKDSEDKVRRARNKEI